MDNQEGYRLVYIVAFVVCMFGFPRIGEAQDVWLMKGHDVRRTGQSGSYGPLSINPALSWEVADSAAFEINVGASIDNDGVYYGSWGLLRKDTTQSVLFWDKSDGQIFGRDLETGVSLWGGAADLDLVPRCYDYDVRERDGNSLFWCGLFNDYHVSFYNGTVEGQAAIDVQRNVMYYGRGDGKLYAVNPETGEIVWRYQTYNPVEPDDPDGGGEVVTSPLVGPNGSIYFGTWGEGDFETEAVYAVNPVGTLDWRYPSDESLSHRIFASPALSPDSSTIYFSTFGADSSGLPGYVYAFNVNAPKGATDEDRLKWRMPLVIDGSALTSATLAVTSDGQVLIGGWYQDSSSGLTVPVVVSVVDTGAEGQYAWDPFYTELRDGSQFVLGLGLREIEGATERIYATTANLGTPFFNSKVEGALYALDLNGTVLGSYDPSDDIPEAVGSLNSPAIGADGVIYFGVRGRFGDNAIDGHYFGVRFDPLVNTFSRLWNYQVEGHIEWNHPSIGPNGAVYGGSSTGGSGSTVALTTYHEYEIPEGSTAHFYRLGGATSVGTDRYVPNTDARIDVYPNPAGDEANLLVTAQNAGPITARLYSITGRQLAEVKTFVTNGEQLHLSLSSQMGWGNLSSGIYIVRVVYDSGRASSERMIGNRTVVSRAVIKL